jgi:hypothetical protein
MKILDLMGVDLTAPSVIGTFSTANQGKSTLMTYFVKELHENGKTISIISEEPPKTWLTRLKNIECTKGNSIIYKQLPYDLGVLDFIKRQKDAIPSLDCVIVDRPFELKDRGSLTELCNFIRENNMMLFVAQSTRRLVDEKPSFDEIKKFYNLDTVLSLTRKPIAKLPFLKRIVNFITKPFGYIPFKGKNVTLKVLKNRYGRDDHSLDLFLDFKKVNQRQ